MNEIYCSDTSTLPHLCSRSCSLKPANKDKGFIFMDRVPVYPCLFRHPSLHGLPRTLHTNHKPAAEKSHRGFRSSELKCLCFRVTKWESLVGKSNSSQNWASFLLTKLLYVFFALHHSHVRVEETNTFIVADSYVILGCF